MLDVVFFVKTFGSSGSVHSVMEYQEDAGAISMEFRILLEEVPVVKLYFGDWTLIRLIGSFLAGQVRSLLLVGVLEGECELSL